MNNQGDSEGIEDITLISQRTATQFLDLTQETELPLVPTKAMTREVPALQLVGRSAAQKAMLQSEPAFDSRACLSALSRTSDGEPIDIPLCRFLFMEAVRPMLDNDVKMLYSSFVKNGYIWTGGLFYASIEEFGTANTVRVDDERRAQWDDIWRRKSDEFDAELAKNGHSELIGQMFWVWEGNHRCKAWTKAIEELYEDREDKHVSVKTLLLDAKVENQVSILQACQDVNGVLERGVVTSRFIHELLACRKWASQPIEWWRPFLTFSQQTTIGGEPDKDFKWLAVPREIIVDLLYKSELKEKTEKKVAEYVTKLYKDGQSDVEIERLTRELDKTKLQSDVRKKLIEHITRVLIMTSPDIPEEWFEALKLLFERQSDVTFEKLDRLVRCPVPWEYRIKWIKIWASSDEIKERCGFPCKPGGNTWLDPWLSKRTFLCQLKLESILYLEELQKGDIDAGLSPWKWARSCEGEDWIQIDQYIEKYTMQMYYKTFANIDLKPATLDLKKTIWRGNRWKQQPHHNILRRCVYRYIKFILVERKFLQELPDIAVSWASPSEELWSRVQLDAWPVQHLVGGGWYLDLPIGDIPAHEAGLHAEITKAIVSQEASGPAPIVTQERINTVQLMKEAAEPRTRIGRKAKVTPNPAKSTMPVRAVKDPKAPGSKLKAKPPATRKRAHKEIDDDVETDSPSEDEASRPALKRKKKGKVALVELDSRSKPTPRDYKLLPCSFSSALLAFAEGNFEPGACSHHIKTCKDYIMEQTKDIYDLAVVNIPDGWPVRECPDWISWNSSPLDEYLESVTSLCNALLKKTGAILVFMTDDRLLERRLKGYIGGSKFEKEYQKWHIWNSEYLTKPDGKKTMMSHAFCFANSEEGFELINAAQYIDDCVDAYEGDVIINYLRANQYTLRSNGKPVRGSREKPPALMQQLIEICCPSRGAILDLSVGTGATMLAAVATGRYACGFEEDKELLKKVNTLLIEATPTKATTPAIVSSTTTASPLDEEDPTAPIIPRRSREINLSMQIKQALTPKNDHWLPCYAEAIARREEELCVDIEDELCNDMPIHARRRCYFIDDEAEEDL